MTSTTRPSAKDYLRRAVSAWLKEPSIEVPGRLDAERLPIVSCEIPAPQLRRRVRGHQARLDPGERHAVPAAPRLRRSPKLQCYLEEALAVLAAAPPPTGTFTIVSCPKVDRDGSGRGQGTSAVVVQDVPLTSVRTTR